MTNHEGSHFASSKVGTKRVLTERENLILVPGMFN
jgi:hypothetical protein